jgi:hypothetical protein
VFVYTADCFDGDLFLFYDRVITLKGLVETVIYYVFSLYIKITCLVITLSSFSVSDLKNMEDN